MTFWLKLGSVFSIIAFWIFGIAAFILFVNGVAVAYESLSTIFISLGLIFLTGFFYVSLSWFGSKVSKI